MNFNDYAKMMFSKYVYNNVFNNNIESYFNNYNDILLTDNNLIAIVGNEFNSNLLDQNNLGFLNECYENNIYDLTEELTTIFDLYLKNLKLLPKNKYYFKIGDGDINPDNLVEGNAIVLILNIKLDYAVDFGIFLKKYNHLRKSCKDIEKKIKEEKQTTVKFLFNLQLIKTNNLQ